MTRLRFLLLISALICPSGESRSILTRARADESAKIGNRCSFTVIVRTSCSSPRSTSDRISLSFGDAYGNQVYVPRLDNPRAHAFERCSTDTFQIYGPCTNQICYLYPYRAGNDGWMPSDVTVYGHDSKAVTFYYNVKMPRDKWYGFNNCGRRATLATE
ncbi:embryo-specific protein ATS3B-like [Andrographis paniculata]|uniref:embryo-specific protein ATS3B-like n=1 Tax=Andrographis paniculata TaxID=175694 RepID=UPI0021E713AC|nr:embryo-specific protein ATS3B-like [Andrographis paniculata]